MNLNSFFLIPFFAFASLASASSCFEGQCEENKVCGKVDLSAVYIHVDLLDNGDTVDRMDLPAVKLDGCWAFWKGLSIKPTIMWGDNDKELFTTGVGLGQIIPLNDKITVTPVVGINYTILKTTTSFAPLQLTGLNQTFRSYAPYLALEACWNFAATWRIYGQGQYSWTRNHSSIQHLGSIKEHSQGWSGAVQLEKDINKCWSVNVGGAYNASMSKEKRGLRAYGFKLGIARWF